MAKTRVLAIDLARMFRKTSQVMFKILFSFFLGLFLVSCEAEPPTPSLEDSESLVVLTRNAPTTYYIDRDGKPDGYEYFLTQALGESLGKPVEYKVLDSVEEILDALENGRGHIAAAGLTALPARAEKFDFSPAYMTVTEEVVCRRRGPIPDVPEELTDVSLSIASETSYIRTLQELKEEYPDLEWRVLENVGTEEVIERVWEKRADCTIADSHIAAVNQRYYPELEIAFSFGEERQLVWLVPKDNPEMRDYLESWIPQQRKKGFLQELENRFYSYIPIFDYVDIRAFKRRIKNRLPEYWNLFIAAGEEYNLSPTLLAAQSYQESHWNPRAKSPTGVRGMMMLTLPTARQLGIESRLDPRRSIMGGAKYFDNLLSRLPEEIPVQDRLWFALAAYNLGMGHVYDARNLAESIGRDKNRWAEMREVLPLLAQQSYYRSLRYGYARGHEAVRYVRRIRNYWDILETEMEN